MFLEEYKTLSNINEQIFFLTDKIINPRSYESIHREIQENFQEYIINTKMENDFDSYKFFNTLWIDKYIRKFIFDNIITILNQKYVNSRIILTILEYGNNQEILKNQKIQIALLNLINKTYQKDNLFLIKKYVESNQKKELMLKQIKFRIDNNIKDKETKKFIFDFINCLINDQMFNANFNYLNSGAYKDCFLIGNYVLKIGNVNCDIKLPKSKYFLPPILNKKIDNLNISIFPLVSSPVTEEERNECWANIKDEGIILYDGVRTTNYGKLKQDWEHPFINNNNVSKKFLGINQFNLDSKKKDEIVCIDFDFAFDENDNSKFDPKFKIDDPIEYHKLEEYYHKHRKIKTLR